MAMSNPSSKRIRCDNRRAELLAYARELRDSSSHKQEWQPRRNSSRPKSERKLKRVLKELSCGLQCSKRI
ncbi:hypothetical protein JCGZ_12037 [Jatropha curcas]|uniref:Uncharacterized protein n=1 Tax=Jatropha curcas TaxID=180498 RepID=A0A067KKG5_JATCU|nr:hypothetical protein JCGZ_12037 [Jatropha curcas]